MHLLTLLESSRNERILDHSIVPRIFINCLEDTEWFLGVAIVALFHLEDVLDPREGGLVVIDVHDGDVDHCGGGKTLAVGGRYVEEIHGAWSQSAHYVDFTWKKKGILMFIYDLMRFVLIVNKIKCF